LFFCVFFTSCIIYLGPQLTGEMTLACSNQSTLARFNSCTDTYWYSQVVAQDYANDPGVQQYLAKMNILSRAVSSGQLSDAQAISNATQFAFQLRANGQAAIRQQNNALMKIINGVGTPSAPSSRTSTCTRIGDISGQVVTFDNIACPAEYVPTFWCFIGLQTGMPDLLLVTAALIVDQGKILAARDNSQRQYFFGAPENR